MIVPESPWLALNSHKTDVSFGKASVTSHAMVMFCRFCTDKDVSGIVTLGVTTKGFVSNHISYYKYMKTDMQDIYKRLIKELSLHRIS